MYKPLSFQARVPGRCMGGCCMGGCCMGGCCMGAVAWVAVKVMLHGITIGGGLANARVSTTADLVRSAGRLRATLH